MAVRYRQEMINIANVYFRVDILDNDYVGSVLDFHLKDFEMDWKGQQSERDKFILGSECIVMAQSTSTYDLNTLMDDIRQADEGRFQIAVYSKETSGGSYTLYWLGMVLNDLSGGEDAAPVQHFDIVATDGLGVLKGVDYKVDSTTPYGDLTALQHLMTCLKKIPTDSFYSSSNVFLYEIVGLYESGMVNTTDSVLSRVQVPGSSFYLQDEKGVYTWKSCYEVLEILTVLFKARLALQFGVWMFYDIYTLENKDVADSQVFLYDGTANGVLSVTIRNTLTGGFDGGNRLTGQRFEWFPALKEVTQLYEHGTSYNWVKTVIDSSSGTQTIIPNLISSGTEKLYFGGQIRIEIVKTTAGSSSAIVDVYAKFKLMIKHGIFYLSRPVSNQSKNNDYSTMTWTINVAYVEFIGYNYISDFFSGPVFEISFFTESPFLNGTGVLDVSLVNVYIEDANGTDVSSDYAATASWNNPYIEYLEATAENERLYKALNNTSSFYSSKVDFLPILCGDKINDMSPRRLKVWNGTAWIDSTSTWGRDVLNGTDNILQLGLNEFLGNQRKAVKKRQGVFLGKFNPLLAIGVSSEFYLPLAVRFAANNATFNGEWYMIGVFDKVGIVVIDISIPIASILPPSVVSSVANQSNAAGIRFLNGKIEIDDIIARTTAVMLDSADSFIKSNLSVGTSNKEASAVLNIESTSRGVLFPRMTEAQRNSISSPANGLYVHQTDGAVGLYFYSGSGWDKV